ncbi:peptide methionine sulfoxide reductase-like isoform X4 [Dermacentor albipictus]|uniref:peptide methionine sulfoxide reductase-like isoform X4 n=1 Tax=Dermacentor albipictus TaxID=60249 RepID=UPI0031FE0963
MEPGEGPFKHYPYVGRSRILGARTYGVANCRKTPPLRRMRDHAARSSYSFCLRRSIKTPREPSWTFLSDYTEVVRIEFDPRETSFKELLKLFWPNHDPTREHTSREYMSVIFYHSDAQENEAKRSLEEIRKNYRAPVVTKILKLEQYHLAELHHQKYRLQRQTALYKSLIQSGMKDVTRSHVATRLNGYVAGFGTVAAFDAECNQLGLSADQANAVRALIRKGRAR